MTIKLHTLFRLYSQIIVSVSVIELACGEYGEDKIEILSTKAENGKCLDYFEDGASIPSMEQLRKQYPLSIMREQEPLSAGAEETSQSNQRSVLIKRGFMKAKRDSVSVR